MTFAESGEKCRCFAAGGCLAQAGKMRLATTWLFPGTAGLV
jgi:hypothetical protein